jgi:hypothetical protein
MIPSGPHSSTMGTGERSSMPTVVFRLCGHAEIGPKPLSDQSRRLMSAPIWPPPKGKLSLFLELAMPALKLDQNDFLYREDPMARLSIGLQILTPLGRPILDDNEGIQQVEADGRDHEQIHGGDVRSVVSQKGLPPLTGRSTSFQHVLGDG